MSNYNLTELIKDIDDYLLGQKEKYHPTENKCQYGKCSTGRCNRFDLLEVEHLIEKYNGNDYLEYVTESDEHYQKVRVPIKSEFSDLYDIYILTWNPLQESMIHDHSKNGCILKVIEGELIEKQFTPSTDNPKLISQSKIKEGNHGYINNEMAFHQVGNMSSNQRAVSLHIYSPPGYQCQVYQCYSPNPE